MELIIGGLLLVAGLLVVKLFWRNGPHKHLPPSPRRPLPIVGHLLFLDIDPRAQYTKWRHQLGDIFSLYLGSRLFLFINGYDLIKECLVKRAEDFSQKPDMFFEELMGYQHKGILFSSGNVWKEQRGTTLSILRKFGLGTNMLAERIQNEVICYLDHLHSYAGQPVDIRRLTSTSTANIICSILTGQRYDYDDENFLKLLQNLDVFVTSSQITFLFDTLPFLKLVPFDILGQRKLNTNMAEMYQQFQNFIDKSRDKDVGDNLIAAYLSERQTRIRNGEDTSLDETNLLKCVFDLFLGGTETSSTTICWFVLYMLHYPDCQEKIYREINKHIGTHRLPTIEDKPKLVYLNACIMETQRLANVIVYVVRTSERDLTIRDYTTPRGTVFTFNLDSVAYDEEIWGAEPKLFRPERFIDTGGQLKNPEEFMPFGIGRRICLGEVMARMELFLYLASMCQKFQFATEKSDELPSLDYVASITVKPLKALIRFIERTHSS